MGEKGLRHREKSEFLVEMFLDSAQQLGGYAVEAKAAQEQGKPHRQDGPAQVFDDDGETVGGGVQGRRPGLLRVVSSVVAGASVNLFVQTFKKNLHELMPFGGQPFAFRGEHLVFDLAEFHQKFPIGRVFDGVG